MMFSLAKLALERPGFGWLGSAAVLVGLVAVVAAYTMGLRWKRLSTRTRLILMALRLGAIGCLLVALIHPLWITDRTVNRQPLLAVVLDDSASMALPATNADSSPSRYGRAVQLLRNHLRSALKNSHEMVVYDIAGRPLDPDHLPDRPTAPASPLSDTLLNVQQDLAESPLSAIVLLSDGRQVTPSPGVGTLDELTIPVHTIEVVDAASPAAGTGDLVITAVTANRRAIVGNTVTVTVDLAADGPVGPANVPVTIFHGDRPVTEPVVVAWAPGQPTARVEMQFMARRPGQFTYTVQAGPLKKEVQRANNRQTFDLQVRAKPLTVMFIDGVLRWEGKFIRQALADDPDINVVSATRTARPGSTGGSHGLLLAEQLANVDVVMLGDVEATYFSTAEMMAVQRWVREGGGGLVVTGGYHSFGPQGLGRSALHAILPVVFSAAANPQIEQPFSLKLTEAGRDHPIFHLTDDRVRDAAFFQSLPELGGCSRIAAVKPGAQTLAVNPRIIGPRGQSGLPVVIAQQVGMGRTLVLAIDTTWRWRMVVGGFTGNTAFYQQFWGQLVRWMAGGDALDRRQLHLATDRYRYAAGQPVELTVTLDGGSTDSPAHTAASADKANPPSPTPWRLIAKAIDENGRIHAIPLAELPGGRYRGTLADAPAGRIDLNVSAELPASSDAVESHALSGVTSVYVQYKNLETRDSRPDPQYLAQIAQLTGGRSLTADQLDAWLGQMPGKPVVTRRIASIELWHSGWLAGAFFALLGAEWIMRRRNRLA